MGAKNLFARFLISVGLIFVFPVFIEAQENSPDVEELRKDYERTVEQANSLEERKSSIQKELEKFNEDIENLSKDIQNTDKKLSEVKKELKSTKEKIKTLQEDIEMQKRMIKEYLATLHTEEDVSMMRMILSNKNLSDMVGEIENVNTIQSSLRERIRIVQKNQKRIRSAKKHLFEKERELETKKRSLAQQKNLREKRKRQKKQLLARVNKDLSARREKEQQLASKINALTGAQGEAVSIKQAYEQAEVISSKLQNKISPEYLAAVLMVESGTSNAVGENFGNHYYEDALTSCFGEGQATKHTNAFRKIMNKLNMSASDRLVSSCGAMGYAQFIPATWLGWAPTVQKYNSGEGFPNPWKLEDAMLAAAVKLTNANPSIKQGDDLTSNKDLRRQRALQYYGSQSESWYAKNVNSAMRRIKRLMGDTEKKKQESESSRIE